MTAPTWKAALQGKIREDWAREIDIYETQIELRKKGKIEEKLFAETRLRRGVYGQRYDNGQRNDGEKTQTLQYPCGDLTKGPVTVWDAPGMQRIKVPMGRLSPEQLDVMCDLAEEYSDQILHVTTRQDIQLHFVHIEDTPDLMRRLAAVGITTREACGNSVRNVTACPYAGVCSDESFDVLPYADAMMFFLLGHDDTQDFGRKFKIAFSGCGDNPCGLTNFHDLGCIAKVREVDGVRQRGFEVYVGGGLGAVPQMAQLLDDFVPEAELLPLTQAVCRVFGRLGEKENRARARIKFLVKKLGIEEFKRLTLEERQKLRPDPRWTAFLDEINRPGAKPNLAAAQLTQSPADARFTAWRSSNVRPQRQPGYVTAKVTLPLGDFTPTQGRRIADIARRYGEDSLRTTVEQNLLFRWVPEAELPALYRELSEIGLGDPGADTITDVTSCPGTDTCKLGISSSRGLAAELRRHLTVLEAKSELDVAAKGLNIKCSGCFNSCGQHHIADLGFLGVSRNVGGRRVPHFQLVVGGELTGNARSYGLAIGAIPSKRVPAVVDCLTRTYVEKKLPDESFKGFVDRIGKKEVKKLVDQFTSVPSYEEDPSFYSDFGDPREYTIGDMGVGECAGEVVPFTQFGLAASEREVFEAQVLLDEGKLKEAGDRAYSAMLQAARALTRQHNQNLGEDPAEIIAEFKTHLVDTKVFDPLAGAKFAQFLFRAHTEGSKRADNKENAHQLIEEAQLFVDAAYQAYSRVGARTA
ncbi:MAG TPA: nitrite/sulfite reductase [Polyangiaceae bacterium]|nr:nitrite/sulfite reductase [Polyangiaceae bacterium]